MTRTELDELRGEIDRLDAQLIELLADRFAVSRQVGELKRSSGLSPRDAEREALQMKRLREEGRDAPESRSDFEFVETSVA